MIVAGFSWFACHADADRKPEYVEVVIVGHGDRAHVDALVRAARDTDRPDIIAYFKPFAEGQRPGRTGIYYGAPNRIVCAWWKPVTAVSP